MNNPLHIVLLGDSIFDNGAYVPDGPAVREQLVALLPEDDRVTLLAVDGDMTIHVKDQLNDLPGDATHLVVSCGGNDALAFLPEFIKPTNTISDAMVRFGELRQLFRERYTDMLQALADRELPILVCTIYDQVPNISEAERAALAMFNEIILQEAHGKVERIIDLRLICRDAADYSTVSPIEPSEQGGRKITSAIRGAIRDDGSHVVTALTGAANDAEA